MANSYTELHNLIYSFGTQFKKLKSMHKQYFTHFGYRLTATVMTIYEYIVIDIYPKTWTRERFFLNLDALSKNAFNIFFPFRLFYNIFSINNVEKFSILNYKSHLSLWETQFVAFGTNWDLSFIKIHSYYKIIAINF